MYLDDKTTFSDGLIFFDSPPPSEATQKNMWPFTVLVSAADFEDHYVNLYSEGSRSRPYYEPQSNWGHLLPQWRFADLDGNVTNKIKTDDTIIVDSSGSPIGVTGQAQFYYIDDLPTVGYEYPLMLWATLEVSGRPVEYDNHAKPLPGHSNSAIIKGEPYYINSQPPTHLKVTSNGIDPISNLKWVNTPFRYTITIHSDWLFNFCGSDNNSDILIFDYPLEIFDDFAAETEIHRDIVNVPYYEQTWDPLSAHFIRKNDMDFHSGGFHIGSVKSSASANNAQLSAITDIKNWGWYRDSPYAWISNGQFERIHRISLPYMFGGISYDLPFMPEILSISIGNSGLHTMNYVTSSTQGTPYWRDGQLEIDTFGGIHGIAVSPCYDVWAVDSELDQMYNFSARGDIIKTIDIFPEGSSPQSVVLDGELNMWVTLYGATSTIKFDSYGELTGDVAIPPYEITDEFPPDGRDPDSIRVRPVQVETDRDNNIWVSYENALSSMVIKYNDNGEYLTSCPLPISSQPQGLIVDHVDNSVWVSNTYEILVDPMSWEYAISGGSIQHFTSGGDLINTFMDIKQPGYMTMDVDRNTWFTFGYRGIGRISGENVERYWLSNNSIEEYGKQEHLDIDGSLLGFNDRIKGIASDSRNRIWALDARQSTVYIINANDINEIFTFYIHPQDLDSTEYSLQALGDWTGYRWLQKYIIGADMEMYSISGISNEFNIKSLSDDFRIRKFNESWDATNQVRDYALSDHVYDNSTLFNGYISAMVGGLTDEEDSLGRKSYERIANFVQNNVDIDTCGIDQLYSLAEQLDVPMDDYNLVFPPELKRIMDIISISHNRLWGDRCRCNKNFKEDIVCSECGHRHSLNRGQSPLSQKYDNINGGDRLVVKPRMGREEYDVVKTPDYITIDGNITTSYPICATSSISWVSSSQYTNYHFYKYLEDYCTHQVEGVINWDDEYTTLSETNSSISEWYDRNQLVETILNYELRRGLNFYLD